MFSEGLRSPSEIKFLCRRMFCRRVRDAERRCYHVVWCWDEGGVESQDGVVVEGRR